jgi:polyhydroxybutyrate depolymerase
MLVLAGCSDSGETGRGKGAKSSVKPKPKPSGVAKEIPRSGDQRVTMTGKGEQRVYRVHAPPGYTPGKRLPLVVVMHPYPSDGPYVARLSGFNAEADSKDFLVAYPDGLDQGYNALVCCGSEDDVGFIDAMTQRMISVWKADPNRIYATGISNGADMSYKLAVELPGTFAAVAPVSGGYAGTDTEKPDYVPKTPVSVTTFIGGLDGHYASFDDGIATWQQRLGCVPGKAVKFKDQNTRTSAKCKDGSEFLAYRLPDMGHNWPGSSDTSMGDPVTGVKATGLIWKFFAAHPKAGAKDGS